ncbi:MAG: endo-1,4-beta-xylanase [Anaerolineales bacterium]
MPIFLGSAVHSSALVDSNGQLIENSPYVNHLKGANGVVYKTLTPESEGLWNSIQTAQYLFDFGNIDKIVNWADAHNMEIYYAHLCWGGPMGNGHYWDIPLWAEPFKTGWMNGTLHVLQDFIITTIVRYKDRVHNWNIVNEFASTSGGYSPDNFWYQAINARNSSLDYMEKACEAAKWADPTARLWLNENFWPDVNLSKAKIDFVFQRAQSLRNKGYNIVGIGVQGHWKYEASWAARGVPKDSVMYEFMNRCVSEGFKLRFSEFDFLIPTIPGTTPKQPDCTCINISGSTECCINTQEWCYWHVCNNIYHAPTLNSQPLVEDFMTWQFSDNHAAWSEGRYANYGCPLPLDRNYVPKPAWNGIRTGVHI